MARLQVIGVTAEEAARLASAHYELVPFRKIVRVPSLDPYAGIISAYLADDFHFKVINGSVYFFVECDVHFNLSSEFDLGDIWTDPPTLLLPSGQRLLAQSWADMLWFLAARMYHETMVEGDFCVRAFFDLLAIVCRAGGAIDWARLRAMVEKYALHPSVFYTLWHVRELLPGAVPDEVIAFVDPSRPGVSRLHDWGDFIAKLFRTKSITPLLG
jgi:hypothetical protein